MIWGYCFLLCRLPHTHTPRAALLLLLVLLSEFETGSFVCRAGGVGYIVSPT